jgi:hypothetical protein
VELVAKKQVEIFPFWLMKTVCRQKKVQWVERTMDVYLEGEGIEKEDPESSSGWQNITPPARKLVFPTHCVYVIRWTTEACPLIKGSMRRIFFIVPIKPQAVQESVTTQ